MHKTMYQPYKQLIRQKKNAIINPQYSSHPAISKPLITKQETKINSENHEIQANRVKFPENQIQEFKI